jgi:hypothetical protein
MILPTTVTANTFDTPVNPAGVLNVLILKPLVLVILTLPDEF